MNEMLEFLELTGLLAGGLLARLLLLVLVVSLYAIPIALAWGVTRLYRQALDRPAGLQLVDGLLLARERHYTRGHAWLEPRPFGKVRVGLDDIGQRILPGAKVLALPRVGTEVTKGQPVAVIASGDRETSIPSPLSGTITAVNRAIRKQPGLLNRAPYTRGCLVTVRTKDSSWATLPTGGAARDWFRFEEHRLGHFLDAELGTAAADGGEFLLPGPSVLPKEKWEVLVQEFLRG